MATAIDRMSPDLLLGFVQHGDDPRLTDAVLGRLSDDTIARFVARHVSEGVTPIAQIAQAVLALAPDPTRQQRVILRAHDDACHSDGVANTSCCATWDELLQRLDLPVRGSASPEPRPLEMTDVRARAIEVEEASDDPPERIHAWLETVSTTSLGALDLTLVLDLLRIDSDGERWSAL